jgi:hypothetical protein
MADIWFFLFVGLLGYESYKFWQLMRVQQGDTKQDGLIHREPYVDFDYTNEKEIEAGNFLSVVRDGTAYLYTLPSGKIYKSYFPYNQSVEKNYNLPDTTISY